MKLEKLIADCALREISGSADIPILGLATDSRRVGPGSLFFAIPGRRTDGHRHIEEAVRRGAVAVVSEKSCWVPPKVCLLVVDSVRRCLAKVARRFYKNPHQEFPLIGLCGTSGKTVVASLLRALLPNPQKLGLLGTNHYVLGRRTLPSYRTTPEPIELYGMLAQMREFGCERAILEVSSHGIDQGRVEGLEFECAVFTNLSREHMDYHGSMENYYRLIEQFMLGSAGGHNSCWVLPADDPYTKRLSALAPEHLPQTTFGFDDGADFRATEIELGPRDTRFTLVSPEGSLRIVSPLIGRFNVLNVLAALATAHRYGVSPAEAAGRLIDFEGVRGRMERVDEGQEFSIVVDYAHTVASYQKVLESLRDVTSGRLITVFGCGGDRDPKVRPQIMAEVLRASDKVIATADNPRSESVEEIFNDMREGAQGSDSVDFVEDRREAIARAIQMAESGDCVLIAGKGHETFQEFGDSVTPFDDRAVAREIIRKKGYQNW